MPHYLEKTTAALIACVLVLASWTPLITVPAPHAQAALAAPELA